MNHDCYKCKYARYISGYAYKKCRKGYVSRVFPNATSMEFCYRPARYIRPVITVQYELTF